MISSHEASGTGTAAGQGAPPQKTPGSAAAAAAAARAANHGGAEPPPPAEPPATASPSPAPGSLKTPWEAGGARGERTTDDANKPPLDGGSSPRAPATAGQQEDDGCKGGDPSAPGARKRGSELPGDGGENRKRGADGGVPRKRGSAARGVVAVEEGDSGVEGGGGAGKEAGTGAAPPPEKVLRFSTPVRGSRCIDELWEGYVLKSVIRSSGFPGHYYLDRYLEKGEPRASWFVAKSFPVKSRNRRWYLHTLYVHIHTYVGFDFPGKNYCWPKGRAARQKSTMDPPLRRHHLLPTRAPAFPP